MGLRDSVRVNDTEPEQRGRTLPPNKTFTPPVLYRGEGAA
ncbi:hypothetical protein SAMN05660686_02056 [Thalassobaculum litoreum DSM 18839]|uniref:Uncharacterized protein n=1 Tax=Thalassobaculum litoreum DSM 18839 TaxID=1123362 RepID=A0A8G2BJW0_9PROT|nr:hypothetical protein SAMN05660686_02056 [Thalassobaculum litoreum DSM 18839]